MFPKYAGFVAFYLALVWPWTCFGQASGNSSGSGSSSSSPSSSSSAAPASSPTGPPSSGSFSIEAELFGYKSLQSDSEAIACDVAAFLFPDETVHARPYGKNKLLTPPDWTEEDERRYERRPSACKFKDDQAPKTAPKGVIILSSTSNAIANYQLWRLDMTIMQVYLRQAANLGCPGERGEAVLPDISSAIAVVQSALQLFANSESAAEVSGTIQDQALMDGIARELRNMKVPVLLPDVYTAFSLSKLDYTSSPFLSQLVELIIERNCLQKSLKDPLNKVRKITDLTAERDSYLKIRADALGKQIDPKLKPDEKKTSDAEVAEIQKKIDDLNHQIDTLNEDGPQSKISTVQSLTASIDAFVASLLGASQPSQPASSASSASPNSASSPNSSSSGSSNSSGSTLANAAPAASPSAASPPAPGPVPPIISALTADGLSRGLHAKTGDVELKDSDWRILAVKALESGGALITTTNIFGSKVHFGGGAVATYALFSFDGGLACSGNVFDYGGYVRASKFADQFRRPEIEPNKQLLFLRGGCAPPK